MLFWNIWFFLLNVWLFVLFWNIWFSVRNVWLFVSFWNKQIFYIYNIFLCLLSVCLLVWSFVLLTKPLLVVTPPSLSWPDGNHCTMHSSKKRFLAWPSQWQCVILTKILLAPYDKSNVVRVVRTICEWLSQWMTKLLIDQTVRKIRFLFFVHFYRIARSAENERINPSTFDLKNTS